LADTIDLVLVLTGITLLFLEAFIIPGFGIAGIAGMICLMLGTYLSLVNFTFPQYTWDFERLDDVGQSLIVFLGSMTVFLIGTWKLLPKTPFYREMIMSGTQPIDEGYTVQSAETVQAAIGLRGVASTMLRPAGKGRFNNQTYDIVTRGDFVDEGTPVVIAQADGNRYVVEVDTEVKEG
jgi:membrane-bound serine protease (ClpP class)